MKKARQDYRIYMIYKMNLVHHVNPVILSKAV